MATNDIKMGYIQTATWPTPQKVKRLYLKFRPGTCTPTPMRASRKTGICLLEKKPKKMTKAE